MSARPSNMRTPLGRVRGYGSAKSGTDDFIRQRLTAIANIPLTILVVLIVISLVGRNHAAVAQILGSTPVAIVMVLFIISVSYHMRIGTQVFIADYMCMKSAPCAPSCSTTPSISARRDSAIYAILKL